MFSIDQPSAPQVAGEASRDSLAPSANVKLAASLCSDLRFFDSGAQTKVQLMEQATGIEQLLRTDSARPSSPLSAWSKVAHSATDRFARAGPALLGCANTDDDETTSARAKPAHCKADAERITTSKKIKMTARATLHAVLAAPAMWHLKCLSQASCDVQKLGQQRWPSVPIIFA